MLRLDLPPPRAVLAGSPRARIQAGVSRQRESRPARTQGTLRLHLEVPDPFDGSERGQERCLKRQELQLD